MVKRKKILVADGNRMAQEIFKCIFAQAGYEILIAEDGPSAIEKAAFWRPDLVLADSELAGIHGFLVCRAIKEFNAPPKVILLTGGYFRPIYRWEVKYDFGADAVLLKPIDPMRLLASIESQLIGPVSARAAAQIDSQGAGERGFALLQSSGDPLPAI